MMPNNPLDHTVLLTEYLRQNEFWANLIKAMDNVLNPIIKAPVETLANIRDPDVESAYAYLNARMLGFKVSSLAIEDFEYPKLMRNLSKFWQTKGTNEVFIKFISYIKNVELVYLKLYANSTWFPDNYFNTSYTGPNIDATDLLITDYTDGGGTLIPAGGTWFPTPYFDLLYSKVDFPSIDEALLTNLIYLLAPQHLVMRALIGVDYSSAELYVNAIPISKSYNTTSVKI